MKERRTTWEIHNNDLLYIESLIKSIEGEFKLYLKSNEYSQLLTHFLKIESKHWKHIGKCYFPNCNKLSVNNSHSLSKELMLRPISENGHIFSPIANIYEGRSEIGRRIGIKKASIFPGFCQKHESSFDFEKYGKLDSKETFQQQLFRSISHNIHHIKAQILLNKEYHLKIGEKLEGFLHKLSFYEDSVFTKISEIKGYLITHFLGLVELTIEQRTKELNFITDYWFIPNSKCFGKQLSEEFQYELMVLPEILPTVMACVPLFDNAPRNDEGTPDFSYYYFVNIFPNKGKTHILLVSLKEKKELLSQLVLSFKNDSNNIVNFIDYLMIHESKNWYLSPSRWESFSEEKKEMLIDAMNTKIK